VLDFAGVSAALRAASRSKAYAELDGPAESVLSMFFASPLYSMYGLNV